MNNILIIFLVYQVLAYLAFSNLLIKAGRKSWEAVIPFYNIYVLLKVVNRPWWWVFLFYIPIVNNIMFIVLWYELLVVYGKKSTTNVIITILTVGLYFIVLNYDKNIKYIGHNDGKPKGALEWVNAILFAVVAATIIRTFAFEAYTIPTGSMEESMMIGDFLFVSKMHYGTRLPMTPLALPLLHDKIPFLGTKSYSEALKLPYIKLPKFTSIKNNDIVVFNWPADADDIPIDKKMNYIKRCIGIPGDTVSMINQQVFIDSDTAYLPKTANPQYSYYVKIKTEYWPLTKKDIDYLKEQYDIKYLSQQQQTDNDRGEVFVAGNQILAMFISNNALDEFSKEAFVEDVIPIQHDKGDITEDDYKRRYNNPNDPVVRDRNVLFPEVNFSTFDESINWTVDNFGPIYVPKKGVSITLTPENINTYKRVIEYYEGNELEIVGADKFIINGEETNVYTPQMDYYWMMGDNRHNSQDSRFWGFVPENHIVGRPAFIWMSFDKHAKGFKKIRTDRVFTFAHTDGKRVSYFWHFIAIVVLYTIGSKLYKRKKAKVTNG